MDPLPVAVTVPTASPARACSPMLNANEAGLKTTAWSSGSTSLMVTVMSVWSYAKSGSDTRTVHVYELVVS